MLAGKVDGIVKKDGQYFLLEHKTASLIDSGYLERCARTINEHDLG